MPNLFQVVYKLSKSLVSGVKRQVKIMITFIWLQNPRRPLLLIWTSMHGVGSTFITHSSIFKVKVLEDQSTILWISLENIRIN